MKISMLPAVVAVFLLLGHATRAEEGEKIATNHARATDLHDQDPTRFRNDAAARQPIDFKNIDHDLLSAAVFHETNRRRTAKRLRPLNYQRQVREAARIQSLAMRTKGAISHQHPEKLKRNAVDRLNVVGLKAGYSAENVAMVFAVQYESGKPFYLREENGRRIVSHVPKGPPIPPHTYQSFAVSLVDSWMGSPSHRKNILAVEPLSLGGECLHARGEDGMDRFFCTQVFFAPFAITPRK